MVQGLSTMSHLRILDLISALQCQVTSSGTCHTYAFQALPNQHSHDHQVMCPKTQKMSATPLNKNFCVAYSLKIIYVGFLFLNKGQT